jgi:hypothetical protein
MEIQEYVFRTKALTLKTPAKRARLGSNNNKEESSPEDFLMDLDPYSPFFQEDEEAPRITKIEHIAGVLVMLDQGIVSNNEMLFKLLEDYQSEHYKAGAAIMALWLCRKALSATVGKCPAHLAFDYLVPSAWALIGAIETKLDGLNKVITIQEGCLNYCKSDVSLSVDHQIQLLSRDYHDHLE